MKKSRNIRLRLIGLVAALGLSLGGGVVQASTVGIDWTGPDAFNTATQLFAGFQSDELIGISGDGFYHNHNTNMVVTMDLRLDGIWTNIFTDNTSASGTSFSLSNISNITYGSALLDGIRLTATPGVNASFHFLTNDVFNFSVSAVPVPAAVWLFGTALIGLIGFGKRKAKVAA